MSLLLPAVCPVCGAAGSAPCRRCWSALEPAPVGPPPLGLDVCHALLAYVGAGRELVARLKYRNARSVVAWLASAMAALVDERPGVVTWAPTTAARRQERGFDHAEVLARAVGRELDVPVMPLLERATGPPQTGRSAAERRAGPVFRARASPAAHVLVVDDVLTTGATLRSAALALRAADGRSADRTVVGVVAARTPFRRTDRSRSALRTPRPSAG